MDLQILEFAFGTGCTVLALMAGLWGAYKDITRMIIPNIVVAALVILWVPVMFLDHPLFFHGWHQLIAAGVVLAVTFGLFAVNVMGAGDSKLMAAYALWIPVHDLSVYFLAIAVVGGLMAALAYVWQRWGKKQPSWHEKNWFNQLQDKKKMLPYGVAITVAAWWVVLPMMWA